MKTNPGFISKQKLSWKILLLVGVAVSGMGIYFIFFRPIFLPEDILFIDARANGENLLGSIGPWLSFVFIVLGGYALATGISTIYISLTGFKDLKTGAIIVALLMGLTSIAIMSWVNFQIHSDFRWLLLALAGSWAIAILLAVLEKRVSNINKLQIS